MRPGSAACPLRLHRFNHLPPPPPFLSISSIDSIIGKLKAEFSADEKSDEYSVSVVPFEADLIDVAGKGTKTAAEVGIPQGCTFLLVPPVSKRPRIVIVPSNTKEQEGDKKSKRVDAKRYANLKKSEIIEQWTGAKNANAKTVAFEFIEMYGSAALQSKAFAKLSKADASAILSSDHLRCNESEVFEAAIAWANANGAAPASSSAAASASSAAAAAAGGSEQKGDASLIKEMVRFARVPLMTSKEIASVVVPSRVLDAPGVISAYSFVSLRDQALADEKEPPSLATVAPALVMFDSHKRSPRSPPHWFGWDDSAKHSSLTIKEDGNVLVESNNTNANKVCAADIVLSSGVWEWQVELVSTMAHQYGVILGVVDESYSSWENSAILGFAGQVPGYSFSAHDGSKFHEGSRGSTRVKGVVGTTFTLKYNAGTKTLSVSTESVPSTTLFTDVAPPVRPAVNLYGNSSVRLKFKDEVPTN